MRSEVLDMALSRLGDFVELVDLRNSEGKYAEESLKGISINKVLTPTKADTSNLNLRTYKILKHNWFTYCTVTSRNGNKISLAYNDGDDCLVSSINPVFKVKDESKILPRYLMMFLNRLEFDRYARFNSWGSARETFAWDDFCNIELEIPSLEIQRKYVAIYESMLANVRSYEKGLDDLKLVCDSYIEKIRAAKRTPLKGYLKESDERNELLLAKSEKGISIQKTFIDTKAKAENIKKQKLVRHGFFAFNSNTSRNSDTISIALNDGEPCAVSATYIVFSCNNKLIARYLYLWFKRKEFDRFARFNSWGSARETISLKDIEQAEIAIPGLDVQKKIIEILSTYQKRKEFVTKIKNITASICPVLIRGSLLEARTEDDML